MKVVVFGANTTLGKLLIRQALAENHTVTAYVPKAKDLAIYETSVNIIKGDLLDLVSIRTTLLGQDVVVAPFASTNYKEAENHRKGMANIIYAMKVDRIQRLICITSATIDEDPAWGFIYNKIMRPLFHRKLLAQLKILENDVMQSNLDWTIIAPGKLMDDYQSGHYRVSVSEHGIPKGGKKISRADVADLTLKNVASTENLHKKLIEVY